MKYQMVFLCVIYLFYIPILHANDCGKCYNDLQKVYQEVWNSKFPNVSNVPPIFDLPERFDSNLKHIKPIDESILQPLKNATEYLNDIKYFYKLENELKDEAKKLKSNGSVDLSDCLNDWDKNITEWKRNTSKIEERSRDIKNELDKLVIPDIKMCNFVNKTEMIKIVEENLKQFRQNAIDEIYKIDDFLSDECSEPKTDRISDIIPSELNKKYEELVQKWINCKPKNPIKGNLDELKSSVDELKEIAESLEKGGVCKTYLDLES